MKNKFATTKYVPRSAAEKAGSGTNAILALIPALLFSGCDPAPEPRSPENNPARTAPGAVPVPIPPLTSAPEMPRSSPVSVRNIAVEKPVPETPAAVESPPPGDTRSP